MINYTIDLSLPYATEEQPGIGGRLRAKPQHFEVYEIPLYEASGEGEHLYVNITKVGLTTKQVQTDLARLFGLKKTQVGFAGLKDKHAQTTQTFSLGVGHRDPAYAGEAAARIEDHLDVEVNWARFHRNKLKTGHLLGNRFTIVVSNLECDPDTCLDRCTGITQSIVERGIPNYFGPQRFGRNGSNVEQGLGILNGSVSRRDKWLRKFLVGSVQSYLCNLYLAERFNTGYFDSLIAGDVAKKYETGGMFAVEDLPVDQLRYEAFEISFTAPVYGPKMWPATGQSGDLESEILARASLTLEHFKRVRVSGTRRLGRLLVDDLSVSKHSVSKHEEGIVVRFSLPKGAYATTIMREFMKNDDEFDSSEDVTSDDQGEG